MEESQTYKPSPCNNGRIHLSEGMLSHIELIARNVHEEWAGRRMQEGWRYGPARDDKNKLHPSLIAYEDLPEEEKEYDRLTAISTLKMVIALGYTIT